MSSTAANAQETQEPWKHLLELPARATWRVATLPPDPLRKALDSVLKQAHKRKYLERINKEMSNTQRDMADRRTRHRQMLLLRRRQKEEDKPKSLRPLCYGRDQVLASFRFRAVSNFSVTKRVLEEAQSILGAPLRPRRILDFGMGSGAATAACLDVAADHSVEWIHGVDASQTAQEGAESFLREYMKQQQQHDSVPPRLTFSSHLSATASEDGFDVALCCYTAMELPHVTSALAAAALLYDKLAPNGIFVMIEPGTPDGFGSIRTVRNLLLDSNSESGDDEEYCKILAPCTHQGPCPVQFFSKKRVPGSDRVVSSGDDKNNNNDDKNNNDDEEKLVTKKGFCSFVHSMPATEGYNKSEKFSYLVVQKKKRTEDVPTLSSHNVAKLLAQTLADDADVDKHNATALRLQDEYLESTADDLGLELVRSGDYSRIIHAPVKHKGHIYVECCADPGRIARYRISKSDNKVAPGLYAAARKSRWGGLWPNVKELEG